MQRVLGRTAAARRQAARRFDRYKEQLKHEEHQEKIRNVRRQRKAMNSIKLESRKVNKEDWELGPLAPRRDFGEAAVTYGTVDHQTTSPIPATPEKMRWQEYVAKNGWLRNRFIPNDRVVVIQGRLKGKIGVVSRVLWEQQQVFLKNINAAYLQFDEYSQRLYGAEDSILVQDIALPLSDIRLVYPVEDAEGNIREVIVDRMLISRIIDPNSGRNIMARHIPGLNIEIHTPYVASKSQPEPEFHDDDTLRISSEERTWVPSLAEPPFEPVVLDELRGKYSKFRQRHDPEWVAKRLADDEKVEVKKKAVELMRTPAKDFSRLQRREASRIARKKTLADDTLALLGEAMARKLNLEDPKDASSVKSS